MSTKITQEICDQLAENKKKEINGKIINPVTGRAVSSKNASMKKLEKDCKKFEENSKKKSKTPPKKTSVAKKTPPLPTNLSKSPISPPKKSSPPKKEKKEKKEKKVKKSGVSKEVCDKLVENKKNEVNGKIVNPQTGRKVAVKNASIKKLEKDCTELLEGKKIVIKNNVKKVSKKQEKEDEYELCKQLLNKEGIVNGKILNPFSRRMVGMKGTTFAKLEKKCQAVVDKYEKKKSKSIKVSRKIKKKYTPGTLDLSLQGPKPVIEEEKEEVPTDRTGVKEKLPEGVIARIQDFEKFEKELKKKQTGKTEPMLELEEEKEEVEETPVEKMDELIEEQSPEDLEQLEEEVEEEIPEAEDVIEEIEAEKKTRKEPAKNKKHFEDLIKRLKNNELTNEEINEYLKKYNLENDIHYLRQLVLLKLQQMA